MLPLLSFQRFELFKIFFSPFHSLLKNEANQRMPLIAYKQPVNYPLELKLLDDNNLEALQPPLKKVMMGAEFGNSKAVNSRRNSIPEILRRLGTINRDFSRQFGNPGKSPNSA